MKSNLDQMFKSDETSEQSGVWLSISDDVAFRVKRFSDTNPEMKSAMAKYFKPFAAQIERGTLSADKERGIMIKVFVNGCVEDWRGIEIDGQQQPFSKAQCIELLQGLPELFVTLFRESQKFDNYKADLGNS